MKPIILTWITFLLSPIFSIPLILKDIYNKKRSGYILIIILLSLLSYLYIPNFTQDKAYYFELHKLFSSLNFKEVIMLIASEHTDFIFYLIIYLFSKLGFSFSFTSAIITGITVSLFMYILRKNLKKFGINKSYSFYFFIMFISSFSLPEFFSGMRFYLAAAFVVMGLHESIIENKIKKGVIYLVIAPLIHFSTGIYLFILVLYIILKKHPFLLKTFFLTSFIFLIIPKELYLEMINHLNLSGIYLHKANSYLSPDNDFLQKNMNIGNFNNYIRILFDQIWYYIVGAYLIYRINQKNVYLSLLMLTYSINNIFYITPTIFSRYSLITLFLFILLLIYDYKIFKKGFLFRHLFFLLLITTSLFDVIALREIFYKSYFKINVLTLPTILAIDPTDGIGSIHKTR